MSKSLTAGLCVIGGGSAGLSVAAVAARMGVQTILIEANRMGGDCLNTGCVPSKSLIAAAKSAESLRRAPWFGIAMGQPNIDFQAVHDHIHRVIATIAPHDSVERFHGLGCTVLREKGYFLDERTVQAGKNRISARRFVVATGSRPAVPPIPGLDTTPFLTNETIFNLTVLPSHLIIIGAGPIGCEMGQAFRRLGASVTILDKAEMMPKDDPQAVAVVKDAFRSADIAARENIDIERIQSSEKGVSVLLVDGQRIEGSHLLVATGRQPNVENLGLEQAGIEVGPKGIKVDRRLRTTNKKVFAGGDVAGGPQFTHLGSYHAGIIIRNALLRWPSKVDLRALPWVTYTDPELAQVGATESQARAQHGDGVRVLRADFADNDRAQTERQVEGFVKVMTDKRGHILGATIVGPHAGELIQTWALAISAGLTVGKVAQMISPYLTLGEINKSIAGNFFKPMLFGRRMKWLVRALGVLG